MSNNDIKKFVEDMMELTEDEKNILKGVVLGFKLANNKMQLKGIDK